MTAWIKNPVFFLTLAALTALSVVGSASVGVHKAEDLRRKMAEITQMRDILTETIENAARLRAELIATKRELVDEIRAEQERHGFRSFQAALQHPRVRFNLKLVGRIGVYVDKLSERIAFFKDANIEMTYLYRRAEDDLKMVQTVDDMMVDDLMSRINGSLTSYRMELDKKLINVRKVAPAAEQRIWEDILAGNS